MTRTDKRLGFLPSWRLLTYVLIGFNALMVAGWMVTVALADDLLDSCADYGFEDCDRAVAIGGGVLGSAGLLVWFVVDAVLGTVWLATARRSARPCPVCGSDVRNGHIWCQVCGFDFRAAVYAAGTRPS